MKIVSLINYELFRVIMFEINLVIRHFETSGSLLAGGWSGWGGIKTGDAALRQTVSDSGFEWLSWTLYSATVEKKKKEKLPLQRTKYYPKRGKHDQAMNQLSSSSGALWSYGQVCMTRITRYLRHLFSTRAYSVHRVPWLGYGWGEIMMMIIIMIIH